MQCRNKIGGKEQWHNGRALAFGPEGRGSSPAVVITFSKGKLVSGYSDSVETSLEANIIGKVVESRLSARKAGAPAQH